jgi:arsenate reductase-like glutaredoxin family protein
VSCGKTQEFLAQADIEAKQEVNAKKETVAGNDALALLKDVNHLYAAKGKRVVQFDLKKDKPAKDELLKVMLGPTGNLRAPTLRVGKKLLVGFNQEMYESVFG